MQEQQPFVAGPAVVNHNSNIGHQILDDLDSIVVKQKADYIQNLGCQVENKYKVYAYQPSAQDQGFIGKKLFKCREHSTCCMRYCVAPSCREFQVGVYKTGQFKGPFLRFQRDYKATCFCLNRPELRVYHTENATEYNKKGVIQKSDTDVFLGTVRDPCDCCGIYFNIFNQNDILAFTIYGKCCQCGLCCRCPCSPCNKVVFEISDPKGEKVGEIQNVWAGCKKECCSTANNFIAHLPLKASWKEKSLLLGAILFIDFSYFEEKKKNNNNGGGGGGY